MLGADGIRRGVMLFMSAINDGARRMFCVPRAAVAVVVVLAVRGFLPTAPGRGTLEDMTRGGRDMVASMYGASEGR